MQVRTPTGPLNLEDGVLPTEEVLEEDNTSAFEVVAPPTRERQSALEEAAVILNSTESEALELINGKPRFATPCRSQVLTHNQCSTLPAGLFHQISKK